MALNLSGLANNGSVIGGAVTQPKQTLNTGLLNGSAPNVSGLSLPNNALTANSSGGLSTGTHAGMIPSSVTTTSPTGATTTSKVTSNPSVLAQQQALNKLGAGLVEDGIIGDKTRAAIAKYGTPGVTNSSSGTTTKAPDDASYKFNTMTGQPNVNYKDPNITTPPPTVTPPLTPSTTPQVGTTTQNAQTVLNSGQQTPQEQTTYNGLLGYGQGKESPEVEQARKNLLDAEKQFAQQTSDINQSGTWTSRAEGEQGQANIQNSNVLNALTGTLNNALTSQGQQIGALGTAQSGAQTTADRGTGTAENVLGASLPGQIGGSNRTYNPLDPTGTQGTQGIINGANNQSTYDLQGQYNQGKVALQAADGIQKQIISTLQSNPDLNQNPISLLTHLNEYISGQTGTPGQQLLAQQINSYIATLGIDPSSLVSIQNQQQGTMAQLLDSLRQTAQAQNDAKNPANFNLGGSGGGANDPLGIR